jgi:hypothetical protein
VGDVISIARSTKSSLTRCTHPRAIQFTSRTREDAEIDRDRARNTFPEFHVSAVYETRAGWAWRVCSDCTVRSSPRASAVRPAHALVA